MRLIIIPFNDSFSHPIEDEFLEIETNSEEKIKQTLYVLKEGSNYNLELYKNMYNNCIFQIGKVHGAVSLIYNKKNIYRNINEAPYDTIIHLIKLYAEENGEEKLHDWISNKNEEEKKVELEKYNKWKTNYNEKKKQESKNATLKTFALITIAAIIITYLFYSISNIKIKKDFIIIKGIVTQTHDSFNYKNNCIKQKVYYRYIIENTYYSGSEYRRCHNTVLKENDSIRIKYAIKNPNYSSIVGK